MIDDPIFRRSYLLTQNLIEVVDQPVFDTSARIATSGNFAQISIEHGGAVRSLFEQGMHNSAFVVLRAQFEAVVRSVWAFYAASDDQVAKLCADLRPAGEQAARGLPAPQDMLFQLSKVPAADVPYAALAEFKASGWAALNSYAHAGLHAVTRHTEGHPMALIISAVKLSNGLAMLAGMQYCVLTGLPKLQASLMALNARYLDCLPIAKSD